VLLLSLTPCCSDDTCLKPTAANETEQSKSPAKEKECRGCSPFFTCGSCSGFVIAKPFMLSAAMPEAITNRSYPPYKSPAVQKIPLSIWLPPKLS